MFYGATSFNQDIGKWNTAAVIEHGVDVQGHGLQPAHWQLGHGCGDEHVKMFKDANSFNQDISDWNTAKVTDMESMFEGPRPSTSPSATGTRLR